MAEYSGGADVGHGSLALRWLVLDSAPSGGVASSLAVSMVTCESREVPLGKDDHKQVQGTVRPRLSGPLSSGSLAIRKKTACGVNEHPNELGNLKESFKTLEVVMCKMICTCKVGYSNIRSEKIKVLELGISGQLSPLFFSNWVEV